MPAVVKTDNKIGFNVTQIKRLVYLQHNLFSCSSCESVDKSKLFYGSTRRDP